MAEIFPSFLDPRLTLSTENTMIVTTEVGQADVNQNII